MANFKLRLLAKLNDDVLFILPHSLFWWFILLSNNLPQAAYRTALYLIFILGPGILLWYLNFVYLTIRNGGSLGKLLTGLRVMDDHDQPLSLRKSLFRHTVGYSLSSLLFGLGYLSVIKDENKLAWHDKATPSKVLVVKNSWLMALVVLIFLIGVNIYLISTTVNRFSSGPLREELSTVIESL